MGETRFHGHSNALRHLKREIVPIVAVVASVLTFSISYNLAANQHAQAEQRIQAEEVRSAERELQSLLQQLYLAQGETSSSEPGSDLKEEADFKDKVLLTNKAHALAIEYVEHLSAFELASVAESLILVMQIHEADEMIDLAIARIATPFEHLYAYRIKGVIEFSFDDVEAGRLSFQSALNGLPEHEFQHEFVAFANAVTEFLWAIQEAGAGECEEARTHLMRGSVLLRDVDQVTEAASGLLPVIAEDSAKTCQAA